MKLNGLDLNKLRIFCAVIENHGYRGASESVGLSRSAISQTITALEAQLKKKLFIRSGIQLIPTPEAKVFFEEVSHYQLGLILALDRFQKKPLSENGLLKIGAYLEFTKGKLMPAIESFLRANPRIQIQFYFDSPSRLESLLEKGRIDLAVSIYPHQKRGIESVKLYEEELCLVGKRSLFKQQATLSEIATLPIVDYFPTHLLFKRWWKVHSRKAAPQVNTRAFAATAEMVLEMVERGLGVGVVPKYLLNDENQEIRVFQPTHSKLMDHLWLNKKTYQEKIQSLKHF